MPDWSPDRDIDPAEAAAALARHLPVATGPVEAVGQGWDNLVLRVGDVYLRIASRRVADFYALREQIVLRHLAGLPLAVPVPLAWGLAEPGLPGPWIAYRPVPGCELANLIAAGGRLREPERLARCLAALHRPERLAGLPDLPPNPTDRESPDALAAKVQDWGARCQQAGLDPPLEALDRLLVQTEGPAPAMAPVLAHGDLHMRHVLVEDDAPIGLIDWGDACCGAPTGDLSVLWWGLLPDQRPPSSRPTDRSTKAPSPPRGAGRPSRAWP